MVIRFLDRAVPLARFLLAQQPDSPLRHVDPKTRAKLLLAFSVLLVLGLGLILLVILGARWTRRYIHQPSRRRTEVDPEDWARVPIVPKPPENRDHDSDES